MKYILAPLADFTDAPFRKMCFLGGADEAYTEMVSAAALFHGHRGTLRLIETLPEEGRVHCQLFGSNEEELAFSAKLIEETGSFASINLNAGCPMLRITRSGSGAKLIETPEKIYKLLKAMKSATTLPITLKTRLGPHPQKTLIFEILDAAEKAGASSIIIHARYTSEKHSGEVHLDVLEEVVSKTKLEIIGNGSIKDAQSVKKMASTGVAGLMIGRAALSKPWIFSLLKGEKPLVEHDAMTSCRMHLQFLLDFHKQLVEKFPNDHLPSRDAFASIRMHTHLFRYFNGMPGAAQLRSRLSKIRSLEQIEHELENLKNYPLQKI
ncbi:MAG: tRNA-dihydrouridine synthase family protein [Kiritimatiellae bacterium]|nr:tRNA-dihydrouridine synthase family protein [Kiritimatiellia bacterium]